METFEKRYKSFTNSQLLEIISNSEDYQPEAVEVAKSEIKARNLSEQELSGVYAKLKAKDEAEIRNKAAKKERVNQVKAKVIAYFNPINPFLSDLSKHERNIRLISIVFGGIAIYQLFSELDTFVYIFTSSYGWDFSILLFLIPYIGLPVSVYLFWKRKKSGWILLMLYFAYSLVNVLLMIKFTIEYEPVEDWFFDEFLLPPSSPTTYIFPLLFYIGTIWVMCGKALRKHYFLTE